MRRYHFRTIKGMVMVFIIPILIGLITRVTSLNIDEMQSQPKEQQIMLENRNALYIYFQEYAKAYSSLQKNTSYNNILEFISEFVIFPKLENFKIQNFENKFPLAPFVRILGKKLYKEDAFKEPSTNKTRVSSYSQRQRKTRSDSGGLMYIPIGGNTKVNCPTAADSAGISITQMAFMSVCLNIFSLVVNVSNNINNNNNNNNLNADNNLNNNNAQLSVNVNNAAQVNVMLPPPVPGKKK